MNFKEFVVEGNDGAAKTPVVAGVKERLEADGISVTVCAPFAIANERLRAGDSGFKDVYQLWISGEEKNVLLGLRLLREVVSEARAKIEQAGGGVLLLDRGWTTILRSMDEVDAEILGSDEVKEELQFWLGSLPPTFFLDTTLDVVKERTRFSRDVPWTRVDSDIENDFMRKREIRDAHSDVIVGDYMVDRSRIDLEPIISDMVSRIKSQLS